MVVNNRRRRRRVRKVLDPAHEDLRGAKWSSSSLFPKGPDRQRREFTLQRETARVDTKSDILRHRITHTCYLNHGDEFYMTSRQRLLWSALFSSTSSDLLFLLTLQFQIFTLTLSLFVLPECQSKLTLLQFDTNMFAVNNTFSLIQEIKCQL